MHALDIILRPGLRFPLNHVIEVVAQNLRQRGADRHPLVKRHFDIKVKAVPLTGVQSAKTSLSQLPDPFHDPAHASSQRHRPFDRLSPNLATLMCEGIAWSASWTEVLRLTNRDPNQARIESNRIDRRNPA